MTLTQSRAPGHVTGWTKFSIWHRVHGSCQNFQCFTRFVLCLFYSFQWVLSIFGSRIIRRMMCESTLLTNAEIAPMRCCLGEPDCLAGITMLLDWSTWHAGTAVVSVSILPCMYLIVCFWFSRPALMNWMRLLLISTSSHDKSLLIMIVCLRPLYGRKTLNSGVFWGRLDRYTWAD